MKYILSLLLLSISLLSFAQVGDIKHDVEVDKSSSSTSSNNQSSSFQNNSTNEYAESDITDITVITKLFGYILTGIYEAQVATLNNIYKNPELISLESINKVGYFEKYNGTLFTPHIRGNWGIFSTDFRVQTIHDKTGTLTTTDWQILQFNLPIEIVRITYGVGTSYLSEYSHSYLEQTIKGELRFAARKGTISLEYRIAKNNDSAFRKEINTFIDYELLRRRKFHLSPSLMVSKQTYFNTTKQLYVGGGVNMRIF